MFANTVTVRALDTFGNVLAQQTTTNVPDTNNWQTLLTSSTSRRERRDGCSPYATSPQNGAIVASSTVNVSYGAQCFVRTDWPIYVVQAGDTLLRIAQRVGSTVTELAYANCLPNANLVYVGQQLRVPRLPVPRRPLRSRSASSRRSKTRCSIPASASPSPARARASPGIT